MVTACRFCSSHYKRSRGVKTDTSPDPLETPHTDPAQRSVPTRTRPFLDVGAGEVACRTVGAGPDVLFVHGWPVSGATFRKLLPHLVDHVTCHVIDLPGAGSSRFDANTLTVEHHFENVRRVVDLLELDGVAVVGHDSGGLIARHAVAGDPRLRPMGLINTEPAERGVAVRVFIAARLLPGSARASVGWPATPIAPRQVRARRRVRRPVAARWRVRRVLPATPARRSSAKPNAAAVLLKSFDMQHVTDLADVHRRGSTCPVQLVWGDRGPVLPDRQRPGRWSTPFRTPARRDPRCRPVLPRGASRRGRRRTAAHAHPRPLTPRMAFVREVCGVRTHTPHANGEGWAGTELPLASLRCAIGQNTAREAVPCRPG